ncbi:Lin0512 family protein [Aliiroseovarius crassostreae]|uniref:Lin0512 family protein n=1 Tax=Aliiroseovarius crassostreae TaxID=154981 RepID=A0A9Q9LU64_9RHOB|nr:Lin0512 family protein [Aliiroseovarius crassostreae]UWP95985.1 Lin0512 family protein [Aliiroseovarius crassostreae]
MGEKRMILEMGTGNDLYGQNYTKAACRAVQDALHHSSITLFTELGLDHSEMRVAVTIGVAEPAKLDLEVVRAELPRGRAEVQVVKGGMNTQSGEQIHVVAVAAIEAWLPDQAGKYRRA